MSRDGQGIKCRRKITENYNRLSTAHERYKRQTDRQTTYGQAIAYSEREREFTFAKKRRSANVPATVLVLESLRCRQARKQCTTQQHDAS